MGKTNSAWPRKLRVCLEGILRRKFPERSVLCMISWYSVCSFHCYSLPKQFLQILDPRFFVISTFIWRYKKCTKGRKIEGKKYTVVEISSALNDSWEVRRAHVSSDSSLVSSTFFAVKYSRNVSVSESLKKWEEND